MVRRTANGTLATIRSLQMRIRFTHQMAHLSAIHAMHILEDLFLHRLRHHGALLRVIENEGYHIGSVQAGRAVRTGWRDASAGTVACVVTQLVAATQSHDAHTPTGGICWWDSPWRGGRFGRTGSRDRASSHSDTPPRDDPSARTFCTPRLRSGG